MIRCKLFAVLTLAVLLTVGVSAQAATWTWTGADAVDGNNWHDPDNWNTPAGDANIPGVGDYVGDDVTFSLGFSTDLIDLNGTSISVGAFRVGSDEVTFADTGGTATITCTSMDFYWNGANHYDQHFYPDVKINGGFTQASKNYRFYFHGALEAESLAGILGGPVEVHGPLTVTDGNPVDIFHAATSTYRGGGQNYSLYDVLNCDNGVALSSYSGASPVQMYAKAATTLSGVTGTFDVGTNSMLHLTLAQTALPSGGIVVQPYGMLHGAMGAATTWGPGNDIDVKTDGVLAITSGTEPTTADIGADVAWKAVTSTGTTTVGAPGTTVYKGLAVTGSRTVEGWAYENMSGLTLQSTTGPLEILMLPGLYWQTSHNATFETLDQNGIANLHMRSGISAKGGRFNQTSDANSVTTFNFIGESGADTGNIANLYWSFEVKADQTFNFSGTGTVNVDPDYMKGELSFSGTTMYTGTVNTNDGPFKDKATYPDVKLTFNDGAALSITSASVSLLENLDANQIVTTGTPILALQTGGSSNPLAFSPQFDITDANNPRLVALMKQSNVNVQGGNNNYADMQGDGIQLGDGKYLIGYSDSHKGVYLRADANFPNAMIHSAGPGTTMGIGCSSNNGNDYLGIYMPIDANGATVLLNSADSITTAKSGNKRYTGPANKSLRLYGVIHEAAEVVVLNSGVKIYGDTIDSGTLLDTLLPIRVASTGTLEFDPTVTDLAKTQITIDQGGRVYVDNDMSVNSMVLSSTYSAGADGLQINSSDDDLTITGRLSGNGAWGDDGQLVVAGSATVAPGNSVGELAGKNLTLAEGATYEWQVADADGVTPGEDWDLISAEIITFEGLWTLKIPEANLAGSVADTSFIVASVTGAFNGFDPENVTIDLSGPGWTGGSLAIDGDDLILSGLVSSLPGDADGDGDVDAADYIMIKRHFGGAPGAEGPGGDLNGDEIVDWYDLQILQAAYDAGAGANTIPEPATLLITLTACLPALLRRRQRRS